MMLSRAAVDCLEFAKSGGPYGLPRPVSASHRMARPVGPFQVQAGPRRSPNPPQGSVGGAPVFETTERGLSGTARKAPSTQVLACVEAVHRQQGVQRAGRHERNGRFHGETSVAGHSAIFKQGEA